MGLVSVGLPILWNSYVHKSRDYLMFVILDILSRMHFRYIFNRKTTDLDDDTIQPEITNYSLKLETF